MTETDPSSSAPSSARSPSPPRWRRIAARVARVPLLILVTLYFLIDDVVLAAIRPIVARLAELRLFARMAEALQRLPPYPTLILFLVPFVVLEPFKLWGLWLLATGHLAAGGTMLAVSHLSSIVLVERLFHATRDKLLTIAWFAWIHGRVSALYAWSLGRLRATSAWRIASGVIGGGRSALRAVGKTIRGRLRPIFAALRVRAYGRFGDRLARLGRVFGR